jgi:hypothetical protein
MKIFMGITGWLIFLATIYIVGKGICEIICIMGKGV